MKSLTAASRLSIGIASALALFCMLGIAAVIATAAGTADSQEEQQPEALSDALPPAYRPIVMKDETIAIDAAIDANRIAAVRIGNYPSLGPDGDRYTTDRAVVAQAAASIKDTRFVRWNGYAAYQEKKEKMAGGYYSNLALLDESGRIIVEIGHDPGMASADQGEIFITHNDDRYLMEGNWPFVAETLESFVVQAKDETGIGLDETNARGAGTVASEERTWLFEDEFVEGGGILVESS
ncbi:MAG: hypothetical protein Q4B69_02300 [Slackia sp.]|nr:hypothetical protein [Slackia sp.]